MNIGWKEKQKLAEELKVDKDHLKRNVQKEEKQKILPRIANKIFSSASQAIERIFPNLTNRLQQNILLGGMNMLSLSYLSILILIAFVLLFIGTAIGVLLFYTYSLWYGFLLGIILSMTAILTLCIYPFIAKKRREKELNEELPFIINHCKALANLNLKPRAIWEVLAHTKYYPAFQKDCKRILNYTSLLNLSISESIKKAAEGNPSKKTKEFLLDLAQTLEEKKSLKRMLDDKTKESIMQYKRKKNLLTRYSSASKELQEVMRAVSMRTTLIFSLLLILTGAFFIEQIHPEKDSSFFLMLVGIMILGWMPLFLAAMKIFQSNKRKEEQFFFFLKDLKQTRNINKIEKDYKSLNKYVLKLKNQYKLGLAQERIFETFAKDTKDPLIQTAIQMSLEAKKQGADFYDALYEIGSSKILRKMLKS